MQFAEDYTSTTLKWDWFKPANQHRIIQEILDFVKDICFIIVYDCELDVCLKYLIGSLMW